MIVEMRPVGSIKPYENNPRLNDGAVAAVRKSIEAFGWRVPIVVDGDGVIVAGHTRFKAAQAMGLQEVPVHVAADLTPEQARAYRIADNRVGELAEWEPQSLSQELAALEALGVEMDSLGWEPDDLREAMGKDDEVVEDEPPAPLPDPVSKTGDLWILGEHRLLCGDSTDLPTVKTLMDGQRAALFATDPPYLVGYDGTNHPGSKVSNPATWDDPAKNVDLYDRFVHAAISEAIAPNAAFYCWYASKRQSLVEQAWAKHEVLLHQQIIWVKSRPVLNRSWYTWQHEPCLFGWLQGNKPRRAEKGVLSTIWQVDSTHHADRPDHPTPKPTELFEIPMRQHTLPGEICYEPFAGSGSQIIAAERTGRRCCAIEIAPLYVDVAVRRWQAMTGLEATLEGDGRTWADIAAERGVTVAPAAVAAAK